MSLTDDVIAAARAATDALQGHLDDDDQFQPFAGRITPEWLRLIQARRDFRERGAQGTQELLETAERSRDAAARMQPEQASVDATLPLVNKLSKGLAAASGSSTRALRRSMNQTDAARSEGAAPAEGETGARGFSLHMGLNSVDPESYDGWDGPLGACEADALSMATICRRQGFEARVLLTGHATREGVLREIRRLAAEAKPGDTVVISYSGHGGQLPDRNRDEDDRLDETWCLFDGQLIDDELYQLWAEFAAGVRIVVFSDSCHSGSVLRNMLLGVAPAPRSPERAVYRAMPPSVQRRTYAANREFYEELLSKPAPPPEPDATVILCSGCQDNQLSQDGIYNGAFTGALLEVWDNGRFEGGYDDLVKAIRRLLPMTQSPNLMTVGRPDDDFMKGRVLSV